MGQPTVRLISRDEEFYVRQVEEDARKFRKALEQWLEGTSDTSPFLQDVDKLRELVRLCYSPEEANSDEYYCKVHSLAWERHQSHTPAAPTVGQLIERLRGLPADTPIELVVGESDGRIDVIELPPLA